MSVASSESKQLRKSQSMPHISSRHDSGYGLSGGGSCSVLDQIGCQTNFNQHHHHQQHMPHEKVYFFVCFLCAARFS